MNEQQLIEMELAAEEWERQVFAQFGEIWSPQPVLPVILEEPENGLA